MFNEDLQQFDRYFSAAIKSDVPLLNKILAYLIKHKGKQMRCMFVLLCARLGGAINEASYHAAVFAEMLHTSSLVHDDVVDHSPERRGAYSVKALWQNRAAVWAGDYLFTQSVLLLLANQAHHVLKIFSGAIGKVIEGELLQLEKSRRLNLD
ncbi:MAG TPA: polyprenyl synthetase family protein, partial [Puia sp.]|nr:polyprenyl synthetase family protein [Puia sp.]